VSKESLAAVLLVAFCLTCGGCAYNGPAAPSFAAMPGPHKSYEAFQGDDQYCQASAQQAIGHQSPGQAANDAGVGTAVVGTALGALAGAALGSVSGHAGTGAAVGAGTGLIAGSAVGSRNAAVAGGSVQARYDVVYAQCMAAKGNRVPPPPPYY
jgi:Glycine-zipper domain